jgi:hypothetical protein
MSDILRPIGAPIQPAGGTAVVPPHIIKGKISGTFTYQYPNQYAPSHRAEWTADPITIIDGEIIPPGAGLAPLTGGSP